MKYGPTFSQETVAAGLGGLPFGWTEEELFGREQLTPQQNATLATVEAAHDPNAQLPPPVDQAQLLADHEARIAALEIYTGMRTAP